MGKVFLDDLPKKGGHIDWKNVEGCIVPFEYDGVKGEVKIMNYRSQKVVVLYKNDYFEMTSSSFLGCRFGKITGKRTDEFRYQLGEKINNGNADYTIINRQYRVKKVKHKNGKEFKRKEKWYKYKCNKCYAELWIIEHGVKNGSMCGCCSNKVAVLGINTIWDKNREMCLLGMSESDAKKYTYGSRSKTTVKCPKCGNEKNILIKSIYRDKSIGCVCGDGGSYPEKFVYNALEQLKVEFIMQLSKKTLNWCKNYRYDFYISNINTIIEVHGLQHYENTAFKRTLEEEQNNDKAKEKLALLNDISQYIIIDCRKSQLEFIKQSIINSKLNELFNLNSVDWNKCEEYALKSNKIIEVCNYWENRNVGETVDDLATVFGLASKTISKYLTQGNKYSWCEYEYALTKKLGRPKKVKIYKEKPKSKINHSTLGKKVEVFKDGNSLGVFKSCMELDRKSEEIFGVKMTHGGISRVCRGERKKHKGYILKYIK